MSAESVWERVMQAAERAESHVRELEVIFNDLVHEEFTEVLLAVRAAWARRDVEPLKPLLDRWGQSDGLRCTRHTSPRTTPTRSRASRASPKDLQPATSQALSAADTYPSRPPRTDGSLRSSPAPV